MTWPQDPSETDRQALWLVLYQVQDPMNFGAVLRSAYLFGVKKILKTSQNSCSLTPVVSKASAGVMEVIDIYSINQQITDFIQAQQQLGWAVIGTTGQSQPVLRTSGMTEGIATGPGVSPVARCLTNLLMQDYSFDKPTILIVGNEGSGLPVEVLRACDQIVYAELADRTADKGDNYVLDSLNVSVATGILLHCLTVLKMKKRT
ncbi:rRNA methyltransferase 1, mitochondrial-like [Liolophura sinensis]|uniref:rRNA methyltransferase 1, mitochondrial-like n=1 Tax=Liolophura sinensis TaxID=3198878 RepID=UPI00315875E3